MPGSARINSANFLPARQRRRFHHSHKFSNNLVETMPHSVLPCKRPIQLLDARITVAVFFQSNWLQPVSHVGERPSSGGAACELFPPGPGNAVAAEGS